MPSQRPPVIRSFLAIGRLLAWVGCSCGSAADASAWRAPECSHRLVLVDTAATEVQPDGGLPARVFYLDVQALGSTLGGTVDSGSMRLLRRDSDTPVPFSLDWRYGDREPGADESRLPVTGYNGEKFPLSAGKLRRLGYLSFVPLVGHTEYELYFALAVEPAGLRPRSDPAVRPWWVDVITDPEFQVDKDGDGKPDLYRWDVPAGQGGSWGIVPRAGAAERRCLQLTRAEGGRLISAAGLLDYPPGVAGRRLVLYQQLFAEKGMSGKSIGVSFPNAYRDPGYAGLYYFRDLPPDQWYELAVEGRVRSGDASVSYSFYGTYDGPCCIGETHLQFPPESASANRIEIDTDVAEPGDEIRCTWQCGLQPYLFPVHLTVEARTGRACAVQAQRLDAWPEGILLEGTVSTLAGKPVAVARTSVRASASSFCTIPLRGVAPGRYRTGFVVTSRRSTAETLGRLEAELWVREGPFSRAPGGPGTIR